MTKRLLIAFIIAAAFIGAGNRVVHRVVGGGVPAPDLLHWPLDDASGSTIVADVGPGTTSSTGTLNSDYLAMAAANGQFSSSSTVTWGTNICTVSFWFRAASTSDGGPMFRSSDFGTTPYWDIRKDPSGTIGALIYGNTGLLYERSSSTWSTNTWTHIAVVLDNTTATGAVKIYINATLSSNSTQNSDKTGTSNFATEEFSVKSPFSDGAAFDADDVRVYAGELSSGDITALYNAGRP